MSADLDIPWVEKYRPKTLDDVAGQQYTINTLKMFVKKGTFPHMIFTGPAGTGKTSAAMSFIYDILGTTRIPEDALLERNASDECRMENLPDIKNFVFHTSVQATKYKFVVLDESDNLTSDFQSALRRIIETAPANVKFIFMCNYVERIIGPILSRCAIFRFYPLSYTDFTNQIMKIAKAESLSLDKSLVATIYYISQGDMRKAINLLQMIVANLDIKDTNGDKSTRGKRIRKVSISPDVVYEISGFLNEKDLKELYFHLKNHELLSAISFIHSKRFISSRSVFRQLMDVILNDAYSYPDLEKIMIQLGEYDFRLTLQADPEIQIDGLMAELVSRL